VRKLVEVASCFCLAKGTHFFSGDLIHNGHLVSTDEARLRIFPDLNFMKVELLALVPYLLLLHQNLLHKPPHAWVVHRIAILGGPIMIPFGDHTPVHVLHHGGIMKSVLTSLLPVGHSLLGVHAGLGSVDLL